MYKQFAYTPLLTTCAWCLRRPEEGIISPKTVVIDTVAMLVLGIKLKNYETRQCSYVRRHSLL